MDVVSRILAVIIPILIGLAFRLSKVFTERDGEIIRRFVVRISVPALVFFSMYDAGGEDLRVLPAMLLASVLVAASRFVLGFLSSFWIKGTKRKAGTHAATVFGNWGWLGFGVMYALLGDEGLRRAVFFILLWWPIFFGFGLPVQMIYAGENAGRLPWRNLGVLVLPVAAAALTGLGFNLSELALPEVLELSLRPFAETTVPLILFSVGMQLKLKGIAGSLKPALLVSACVLLIAPLAGWAIAAWLTDDVTSRAVIILESGMPVATLTPLLADYMDLDVDTINTAIVVSTILSLITLPVIVAIIL